MIGAAIAGIATGALDLLSWLVGTKAGRLVLLGMAIVAGLAVFGAHERGIGRDQVQARVAEQNQQAVEEADNAERDARRDGDLDRSLRGGTF